MALLNGVLQSRRIRVLALLCLSIFAIAVVFRIAFYLYYIGWNNELATSDVRHAFFLGFKFDFRLALLVMMPVFVLASIPRFNLTTVVALQQLSRIYLVLASLILIACYIVDFSYFGYLGERTDASILRFFDTPEISGTMVWESYPVIRLVLGTGVALALLWIFFAKALQPLNRQAQNLGFVQKLLGILIAGCCTFVGLVGKVEGIRLESVSPLRWSEAYFANDPLVAALALNPLLFFYDTLSNQAQNYDQKIVDDSYPIIQNFLNIKDPEAGPHRYYRRETAQPYAGITRGQQPLNIVLVMLESLGANRLGSFGNGLQPTPHIDALIKQSHFFPNFYVPSSGTARTVFGKMTGIPDVSFGGTTASRNPGFVDQQMIANSLEGYQRFYFLGGGANWANIRGVLTNNIEGLDLREEGLWQSPNVDVWGISDRDLFRESHERLMQRDTSKPFFAVIQTAANHRPFTIPDDGSEFEIKNIDSAEAVKHGFLNADQFNAIRLLDYNIGYYINELVAQSNYGDNTLFLFYGDHNDKSNPAPHLAIDDKLQLFKHHVPFFIYAPKLLKESKVFERPMSLIDMMPSAAYLAGLPYVNTTLGRNIYATQSEQSYVMVHGGDRRNRPTIGLMSSEFYLQMLHNGDNVRLHKLDTKNVLRNVKDQHPEQAAAMKALLQGLYHTSLYMMKHNGKLN